MMTRNTLRRYGQSIGGACKRGFQKAGDAVVEHGHKLGTAIVGGGASALAFADPTGVDVTSVTATIAAQLTPIGLIGAAVLGIVVAVKAYKWVRSAM